MTNNENDIDDFDNQDDDFEQEASTPKASIKEAWDNNPLMKIGAVVLGAVVLFGLYVSFSPKEEGPQGKASTNISTDNVKATPGTSEELDPVMRERLEQQNLALAKQAEQQGTSSMPVTIDGATADTISIPQAPQQTQEDPLAAWKQATANRANFDMGATPEQEAPVEKEPEVVTMTTPIRPQQAATKLDPAVAKALADQMRVIIAAQAPAPAQSKNITRLESDYVVQRSQSQARQGANMASAAGAGLPGVGTASGFDIGTTSAGAGGVSQVSQEKPRVITPAGSIAYAQLLNQLNSDIPGPVMAHVLSGPFAGGRALGRYSVNNEYLVLEFSVIVKDGVGYTIQGIALDEKTTLAGHQTDIDRHYFRRVILPAAAKFLEGYASAASEQVTSTTTTNGGGVVQDTEPLDTEKELMAGVEEAAGEISSVLTEEANRPITIIVAKGTTFGILMLTTVTTEDVGMKVGVK